MALPLPLLPPLLLALLLAVVALLLAVAAVVVMAVAVGVVVAVVVESWFRRRPHSSEPKRYTDSIYISIHLSLSIYLY